MPQDTAHSPRRGWLIAAAATALTVAVGVTASALTGLVRPTDPRAPEPSAAPAPSPLEAAAAAPAEAGNVETPIAPDARPSGEDARPERRGHEREHHRGHEREEHDEDDDD